MAEVTRLPARGAVRERSAWSPAALALLMLAYLLALIPAVAWLPNQVAVDPTSASAAAALGYNNTVAYYGFMLWALGGVLLFVLLERRGLLPRVAIPADVGARARGRIDVAEIGAMALGIFLLHWPPALAARGPYGESVYFITIMQRLEAGLAAFRDFEFAYGPLVIGLLDGWRRLFGFGMERYFWLLALLEVLVWTMVVVVLQRLVPERRRRRLILLLLIPLLFNFTLGLSYLPLRWLLPIGALLLVAWRPEGRGETIGAGVLVGVAGLYSHDVGLYGLGAIGALYALLLARGAWRRAIPAGLTVATGALLSWGVGAWLLMGSRMGSYFTAAAYQLERRGAAAEFAFPFHWTLNAVAVFVLIAGALYALGRGLGRDWRMSLSTGDRFFLMALVLTLLSMKGGLSRVDMAHYATALLPLVIALMLPLERALFRTSRPVSRALSATLVLFIATTALGWLPLARGYAATLVGGQLDRWRALPVTAEFESRAPSVEPERTRPEPSFVELGAALAAPPLRDRPVLLYHQVWWAYIRLGVDSPTYASDSAWLSDEEALDQARILIENPDALVVMGDYEYARLYEGVPHERGGSAVERLGRRWLTRIASGHFSYVHRELVEVGKRADRTVGRAMLEGNWAPIGRYGELVLLAREGTTP